MQLYWALGQLIAERQQHGRGKSVVETAVTAALQGPLAAHWGQRLLSWLRVGLGKSNYYANQPLFELLARLG